MAAVGNKVERGEMFHVKRRCRRWWGAVRANGRGPVAGGWGRARRSEGRFLHDKQVGRWGPSLDARSLPDRRPQPECRQARAQRVK